MCIIISSAAQLGASELHLHHVDRTKNNLQMVISAVNVLITFMIKVVEMEGSADSLVSE